MTVGEKITTYLLWISQSDVNAARSRARNFCINSRRTKGRLSYNTLNNPRWAPQPPPANAIKVFRHNAARRSPCTALARRVEPEAAGWHQQKTNKPLVG
jgi:hypothetical protein